MGKTVVERFIESPDNFRAFQQERAVVGVEDQLETALQDRRISRPEFAAMLGKDVRYVARLLDGDGRQTIRQVADAFAVLGMEYRPHCLPRPVEIDR